MARTPFRVLRATIAQLAGYTGPSGEPVMAGGRLHLQDGQTAGGLPVAMLSDLNSKASIGSTPVEDRDYQAGPNDVEISFFGLTRDRTATLPLASDYRRGQEIFVFDSDGSCSEDRKITIQPTSGDIIGGPEGPMTISLISPYQGVRFRRGAANLWIRVL